MNATIETPAEQALRCALDQHPGEHDVCTVSQRYLADVRKLAARRPCAACGRIVAHTLAGTAFLHRCRPELLKGAES